MGDHEYGQRGWHLPRPGKVVKCFHALVMPVKRSLYELFMHYFRNICRLLGRFWVLGPRRHQGSVYGRSWGRKPRPPNLPPNLPIPGKNPAGAHVDFHHY